MRYALLITSLTFPLALASAATPIEDPDRIAAAARAHVLAEASNGAEDIDAQVGPVDRRLRVAACDQPLETFTPPRARMEGRTSVGVRCASPHAWTLYVPARVQVWRQIVVAKRDLQRGDILRSEDIQLDKRDAGQLAGRYYTQIDDLVGMVVGRSVSANRPLSATTVSAAKVIKRGEVITMLAGRNGLEVKVRGKALADGAVGDLIPVENAATRRRFQATVAATGVVRVN